MCKPIVLLGGAVLLIYTQAIITIALFCTSKNLEKKTKSPSGMIFTHVSGYNSCLYSESLKQFHEHLNLQKQLYINVTSAYFLKVLIKIHLKYI